MVLASLIALGASVSAGACGLFSSILAGGFFSVLRSLDPLVSGLLLCLLISFVCFVLSRLTGNCSWVDRLWSIVPPLYVLWFTHIEGKPIDARLSLMCVMSVLWGTRLTYNFARKGGYNFKDEDYRWPIVRKQITGVAFVLFDLFFIALYQNLLLFWIASPAYVVAANRNTVPLSALDFAAAALWLLLWVGEVIADQQQWRFQQSKHQRIAEKKPLTGDARLGFLTHGLFRYSRHPNFFCEFNLWGAFYLFSVAATGEIWNWSLLGYLQLVVLFHNSTALTEEISCSKYPRYKDYQATTSRLVPWFPAEELRP